MARKKPKNTNLPLIFGFLLIIIFVGWRYHNARILSFNTKEVVKISTSVLKPVHIKAYPVGVDVDIAPAIITNGVWPVFPNTAGYVANGNNLIIYGHNKDDILGPIRYVRIGQKIEILDSEKKENIYEVVTIDTIDSNNLQYIKDQKEETLTVYTCTGFLDSKRFIVVAKRIN